MKFQQKIITYCLKLRSKYGRLNAYFNINLNITKISRISKGNGR